MLTTSAYAASATDPANDFLPTFAGAHSGNLDVLSVFAIFDGTTFEIGATVNAPVGTLASALYVAVCLWVQPRRGNSNFAAIGHPGVVFDAVITMTGTGVTGGRDLISNTPITLPAGAAHISGSTFFIDVPAVTLPPGWRISSPERRYGPCL